MSGAATAGEADSSTGWSTLREAIRGSTADFTEISIGRAVVLLAVPMVLEMLMESVFAVADVFFVGRLGAAVLHHLGWSHRVARTTVVRLRASRLGLRIVLAQLSTVTGVDYVVSLGILQSDPD